VRIIAGGSDCAGQGDFRIYAVGSDEASAFTSSESNGSQSLIGIVVPRGPWQDVLARSRLAAWLRQGFEDAAYNGFRTASGHFLKQEAGYTPAIAWPLAAAKPPGLKTLTVFAATGFPPGSPVPRALEALARAGGVELTILKSGDASSDLELIGRADVVIAGARVDNGRSIWTQDVASHQNYKVLLESSYPRTFAAALKIAQRSAATIPVDRETLSALEQAAFDERSIVPLARYGVRVYSRRTSPVTLLFTPKDELSFEQRRSL
jgi:hypothetical protein